MAIQFDVFSGALTEVGDTNLKAELVAFVNQRVGDIVGASPQTLDTLAELSTAIANDASFSSTLVTSVNTLRDHIEANLGITTLSASSTLPNFTGSTIADGSTIAAALQALETSTELKATSAVVAALQADVDQNEADADAAIALKAPSASPAFTGNLITHIGDALLPVVHRIQGGFPDINLRTNGSDVALNQNEGRLLWEDAGGGGVAAIKQTMLPTAPMRFFVGGITDSEERLRILANGRVGIGETNPLAQLHVGGSVLVKADFPDFQMRSGGERRLIFEDAGGGAEGAIKFASNTMKFFTGGIGTSEERLNIQANGRVVSVGQPTGTASRRWISAGEGGLP